MTTQEWIARQRASGWSALKPGYIGLSRSYSFFGNAIAHLQGRGESTSEPSHAFVYYGWGFIEEATLPLSREVQISGYMDSRHDCQIWRPPFAENVAREFAAEARRLALAGRKYDKLNIARHLLDNLVERITWNNATQRGYRPLAALVKDCDGDRQLVCSELVEYAAFRTAGVRFQEGATGQARPADIRRWLMANNGRLVIACERGRMVGIGG